MDRREFLRWLAASAAAMPVVGGSAWGEAVAARDERDALGKVLPRRPLGRAGELVTCIGLGGFHISSTTEALAQATIEAALEEGVRFFDTAESYGPHVSEERYGQFLTPRYRDHIYLMTKSTGATAAEAKAHLEGSLRRMKTDVIDLWQIHAIGSPEDVDARLAAGVLEMALEAKAAGTIRHIGFTGHRDPRAHAHMLARAKELGEPFAACQFPVNPVDAAAKHSFIGTLFPALTEQGVGALAMKTLADGRFFAKKMMGERVVWEAEDPVVPNALTVEDCIQFALSLPVSVLVTGAERPELIREKAAWARAQAQMDEGARAALVEKVARYAAAGEVEYYKGREVRG